MLQQNLITKEEYEHVEERQASFSLFWESRSLLYLGIVLFTTAIGILVYKHIDTTPALAALSAALKKGKGAALKLASPNFLFEYVLLLGSLLLLVFIAYIQAQYNVFGQCWGSAAFIPMLLLFAAAYYFGHPAVLCHFPM